ncbi:MAG: hypothetical protein AB1633_04970 [Elusimicrobiota bacterium]
MNKERGREVNEGATFYLFIFLPIYLSTLFLLAGCGPNWQFKKAEKLENKKYYPQAAQIYLRTAEKYPQSQIAPESLYRAARIYQKELKIYSKAIEIYSNLLSSFGKIEQWKTLAEQGIFDSPDYFPLSCAGKKTEGDSETGGSNMRVELSLEEVSTGVCKITRKYFAGVRGVASVVRYYKKVNFQLLESTDESFSKPHIRLKFPFEPGSTWESEDGTRKMRLKIEATGLTVKVRAGEYNNCIKVRMEDAAFAGSYKYEYFAPDIGLVLTSVGSQKSAKEHRNSELINISQHRIFDPR